jgi:PPOX class probable F420-dependent enzyme
VADKSEGIPPSHEDLLKAKGLAHLATIGPDGAPQTSPVWYDWDGERVLMSNTKGRQKNKNLTRDPRAAVSIVDPEDPYRYIEIRGEVEIEDDPDKTLIHKLSKKYRGRDRYTYDGPNDHRVIFKLTPKRVSTMG